jgi:hypothetical protein
LKKIRFWIILTIITYGSIELVSFGGLSLLNRFHHIDYQPADVISSKHTDIIKTIINENTGYVSFHPTLGWSIKANGTSELYRSNSSGIRSNREYTSHPSPGIRRVLTFGDSFTHCDGVENDETWQANMESYDPNIEVINFGVGGYGLDQAYLRYLEDGMRYESHIVLIGFYSENIYRNVNTFRPFYHPNTGIPLAKPRFQIKDGDLYLIPNPLNRLSDYKMLLLHPRKIISDLGINDYYYQKRYKSNIIDWSPTVRLMIISIHTFGKKLSKEAIVINGRYNENSEAFMITKKIFDEFHHEVLSNKSIPILLIFPSKRDVLRYHRQKEKRYAPLLSYFDSRGYKYIDLIDIFEKFDIEAFSGMHYSPIANKLLAKHVHDYLEKNGLSGKPRVY